MKDPAFLFYPNDYLGGTYGFTFEQKGAYMDILMMQFNRGHMTYDMIAHVLGQRCDLIWAVISDKFIVDENGLYYNARLEMEQNKRKAYTDSRRNNKEGKNQFTEKEKPAKKVGHTTKHMTPHMEDENVNENNKFNFKNSLLSLGVEESIVSDWLIVRKTKKGSNTETAFNMIKSEIEKSGISANDCIKYAVVKNWVGFEAKWLNNSNIDIKPNKDMVFINGEWREKSKPKNY